MKVNGAVIDLGSVSASVTAGSLSTLSSVTSGRHPIPGCTQHQPCVPADCENAGQCVDLWTEKNCLCKPGEGNTRLKHAEDIYFAVYISFGIWQRVL